MSNLPRHVIAAILMLTPSIACSQSPSTSSGQAYPTKPLRLIVPYAGGSGADIAARSVASELVRQLGQQVVIELRPGAGGIIGYEALARAAPDGYTLGYMGNGFSTNPFLYLKLPYDSTRDFQPVIFATSSTYLLAVTPAQPIRSVKDLIEMARAKPGTLSYGSAGNGGGLHISMELFKFLTGTNIVPVPYKGSQQAITDIISGQIHVVCDVMSSILPHVTSERVRALGVTTLKRAPALPEVPTIDEAGVAGYEFLGWGGYILPARVPHAIVLRLNTEINKALLTPTLSKAIFDRGGTVVGGTPEQFWKFIQSDTEKWAKVIRAAGIKPQ